ncbi:MAG: hypothetical protein J6T20_08175 [Treponema sp.]|nr:hypothetical protein [Treponema sp.]
MKIDVTIGRRKCLYITSLILISLVLYTSCAGKIEKEFDEISQYYEEIGITILKLYNREFYEALLTHNVEETKHFLDEDYDPDNCFFTGCIWEEQNPLLIVSSKYYPSDNVEEMIKLLVEYGADINRLPYIWKRVYFDDLEDKKQNEYSNRVIKALLDNGADPNIKGLFAPFDEEKYFSYISMTEQKALKKFKSKKATTPLYEAIKKGMNWESQVDLLLEYGAQLDKSCLKAARLSRDKEMIKKIEQLYNK